eukprot:2502578-Amphidinium_carterae.1
MSPSSPRTQQRAGKLRPRGAIAKTRNRHPQVPRRVQFTERERSATPQNHWGGWQQWDGWIALLRGPPKFVPTMVTLLRSFPGAASAA